MPWIARGRKSAIIKSIRRTYCMRNMKRMLPDYWKRLEDLQRRTDRPMKGAGKSVFELRDRFDREDEQA